MQVHLKVVGRMSNLARLALTDTKVTDEGLEHLDFLVLVRNQPGRNRPVSDAGMRRLISTQFQGVTFSFSQEADDIMHGRSGSHGDIQARRSQISAWYAPSTMWIPMH